MQALARDILHMAVSKVKSRNQFMNMFIKFCNTESTKILFIAWLKLVSK